MLAIHSCFRCHGRYNYPDPLHHSVIRLAAASFPPFLAILTAAAGVDLLSLDGRRAVRCIDDTDIVEDAERFVRVAQEVYKALEALSSSGQFGAFSRAWTEWTESMDHERMLLATSLIISILVRFTHLYIC